VVVLIGKSDSKEVKITDTGIPAFFSIVMVIIGESGALKIGDTIRMGNLSRVMT
jgi:hypothetical protein